MIISKYVNMFAKRNIMLRKFNLLLVGLIIGLFAQSQILQPVKWSFDIELSDNNKAFATATATIDKPWHLYSTTIPKGGPIPTSFVFEESENYRLVGELKQDQDAEIVFDEAFQMELGYFSNKVTFTQEIEILSQLPVEVSGSVEFMACNDGSCLPPDTVDFSLKLESAKTAKEAGGGYWKIFWLAILGGFAALLTPCVFPMIPLTVSFFLRNADNRIKALRDGFMYGLTIIAAYVILGLLISIIFGADALNRLATSPIFNLIFFAILVIFAASFLGAFELTMPSKWSTNLDNKAESKGGVLGIVLMGLTFVLVSFSCTGPIMGTLLVEAATGGDMFLPAVGMLGFGIALAIPFTLFAIFPTAMKSLPKSGGWMNSVKVVLGFLVLAFSLKFLSVADTVGQWGLLDREVFLVIWISLFLLLGLYLIGKIKFANDSDLQYLSVPRLALAIATFSFVFYLIPGLWGAPLKAVGGFIPSIETQDFNMAKTTQIVTQSSSNRELLSGSSLKEGPYGLMKYTDYEEGVAKAKELHKPIFLDFTGLGCANCKTMINRVWSDGDVQNMLADDFVIISLYTDDRTKLPEEMQYVSKVTGKKIRTLGNKWSDFQIENYNSNSQPLYVLLSPDGKQINETRGYNTNVAEYIEWLRKGLENF